MPKENCWDILKCERQPGGARVKELGVCPAATESKLNGTNSGKNGGRSCWAIEGTLCSGELQGSALQKLAKCQQCAVFHRVVQEEGATFEGAKIIHAKLRGDLQKAR